MHTHLTEQQSQNPQIAAAGKIFSSCVHCGFCLSNCPSYAILGDERDSPRGRIYLIKSVIEQDAPADATLATHIDRCLSCYACMSACPTSVNHKHLVEYARPYIEKTYRRPWRDRLRRSLLAQTLPYSRRLRILARLGQAGRSVTSLRAVFLPKFMRRLLDLLPASLPKSFTPPASSQPRETSPSKSAPRIALLSGCVQSVFGPDINAASWKLLTAMGCAPVIAPDAGCCGALSLHLGREEEAQSHIRALITAWEKSEAAGGKFDYIIVSTSGCGSTIKDWGRFMQNDPLYAARAQDFASRCRDLTEIVAMIGLPAALQNLPRPKGRRVVAWHPPCTLQHGQKIPNVMAMDLLRQAGYEPIEIPESHLCCGSAGVYNLLEPSVAEPLRDRKVKNIEKITPDLIASANLGCIMQIQSATQIPVRHLAQLLVGEEGGWPHP